MGTGRKIPFPPKSHVVGEAAEAEESPPYNTKLNTRPLSMVDSPKHNHVQVTSVAEIHVDLL